MSYFLRKISRRKWEDNLKVEPQHFTADAITGCTRTTHNTLSVWCTETVDFTSDGFKKLVVALATKMDKPDTLDLLCFDEVAIRESGIEISDTLGNSKFESMNYLHRDLANLNHEKLAQVGEHIVAEIKKEQKVVKVLRGDLIKWVYELSIQSDTFEISDLAPKWQEALLKYEKKVQSEAEKGDKPK